MTTPTERAEQAPLLDAILNRRSRRFGRGFRLTGPLAYTSQAAPEPLTMEEEALLAFAANGVTGFAAADLPFRDSQGMAHGSGNIMIHLIGRTVASGDGSHSVAVVVVNDDGTWLLKRPQDYPLSEWPALVEGAQRHEFASLYEQSRIRLADHRVDVPRTPPMTPPFNTWSTNLPGTTLFLPIHELTALYINIMLAAFNEDHNYFVIDERTLRPAGLARFAKSKGGFLEDDPRAGKTAWIGFAERWLCEFAAWEEGAMMQNLGLMAAALGLGGFPHFAAHSFAWFEALGFRMQRVPVTQALGASAALKLVARALRRDDPVPTAVGLERNGEALIKPFCPPYYRDMAEAVRAFVDYKFKDGSGTLRDGGQATGWRDGAAVEEQIPRFSDRAIAATIAYCDYVYKTYGRFPACSGPFRTLLAYQAHRLDDDFYRTYYK